MSAYFRILCALADQRALCITDDESEMICATLLDGSIDPLPTVPNLKRLLTTVQAMCSCLDESEQAQTHKDKHLHDSPLINRILIKGQDHQSCPQLPWKNLQHAPSQQLAPISVYVNPKGHGIHTPCAVLDTSSFSKSMLETSTNNDTSETEATPRNSTSTVSASSREKAHAASVTYDAAKVAEKGKYAVEKYVERMNKAHIMRTGPTRLEKMNGCTPLSHRRSREIQAAAFLEKSMDPLHSDVVATEVMHYTGSYTSRHYK